MADMEEVLNRVGTFGISEEKENDINNFARNLENKKVYLCQELTDNLKNDENLEKYLKYENDNILPLLKENNYLYWKYCNGGRLIKKNSRKNYELSEILIQRFVKQIVNGISYLIEKKHDYCGLNLNNIFINFTDKMEPEIGNNTSLFNKYFKELFDKEEEMKFEIKIKYFISPEEIKEKNNNYYLPPEVIKNPKNYKKNIEAEYIWSLGIIIFKLLTDEFPFQGEDSEKILNNITKGEISFPKNITPSLQILRLITRLLKYNPEERLTLTKLKDMEFIKNSPEDFDYIDIRTYCGIEESFLFNINYHIDNYFYNMLPLDDKKGIYDQEEIKKIKDEKKKREEKELNKKIEILNNQLNNDKSKKNKANIINFFEESLKKIPGVFRVFGKNIYNVIKILQ